MAKLDEVSEMIGNLDAKTDMILAKVEKIDEHLTIINGSIIKHQTKMSQCDEKFKGLDKSIASAKLDYKVYGIIAGIVIIITAVMNYFKV